MTELGTAHPAAGSAAVRRRRDPTSVLLASAIAFMALLIALSIQLHAGRDPGLSAQRPAALVRSTGGKPVVTRSSGAVTPVRSAHPALGPHPAVVTRASGGGEHDD